MPQNIDVLQNKRYYSRTHICCQELFTKKSKKLAVVASDSVHVSNGFYAPNTNRVHTLKNKERERSVNAMTLTEMRPGDVGVILAVPPLFSRLQLSAGERVLVVSVNDAIALIDVGGLHISLPLAVAKEMILARYYE